MSGKKKGNSVDAWHFLPDNRRLRYGDGRLANDKARLSVKKGVTVNPRNSGMHAVRRLSDGIQYMVGHELCRVKISGNVMHDSELVVGLRRYISWSVTVPLSVVVQYAEWCAKRAQEYADAAARARLDDARPAAATRASYAAANASYASYAANAANAADAVAHATRAAHAAANAAAYAANAADDAATAAAERGAQEAWWLCAVKSLTGRTKL